MKGVTFFDIILVAIISSVAIVTYNIIQSQRSQTIIENIESEEYTPECYFTLFYIYGNDYVRNYPIPSNIEGSFKKLVDYYDLPIKYNVERKIDELYKYGYNFEIKDYSGEYGYVKEGKTYCQMYIFNPYELVTEGKSSKYLVTVKIG